MIPGAEPNSLRRSGVEKVQDGLFQRPARTIAVISPPGARTSEPIAAIDFSIN
jgi:hypothetical protein